MRIPPILTPHMQRHPRRLHKALQTMLQHLTRQVAHLLPPGRAHAGQVGLPQIDHAVGAVGDVDDGPGEGLVEGGVAAAEADERLAVAERAVEGGAEREEDVFRRVVLVDVEVAVGADGEGPARVFGERV